MSESGLKVVIVPVRTEEDRRLVGMAARVLVRLLVEIILEQREQDTAEKDGGMAWIFSEDLSGRCRSH